MVYKVLKGKIAVDFEAGQGGNSFEIPKFEEQKQEVLSSYVLGVHAVMSDRAWNKPLCRSCPSVLVCVREAVYCCVTIGREFPFQCH